MSEPKGRWRNFPVLVLGLVVFEARLSRFVVAGSYAVLGLTFAGVANAGLDRVQSAAGGVSPSPLPSGGDRSQDKAAKASAAATATASPGSSAAALEVYRASCLQCHDVDGRGELGRDGAPSIPDFTDSKWQSSRSDAQLSTSILEGKGKAMPRMKNKLGSVDVKLMVVLVRGFRDGKQVIEEEPEPAASAGKSNSEKLSAQGQLAIQEGGRLFQKSCAMCHGRDGKGEIARDSLPSIPNFTLRPWQQKRSDAQLLVSILDGKGTGMPAFRDKIPRERARDIVSHIRSFAPGATSKAVASVSDFGDRFDKLAQEFEDLARQIRALSAAGSAGGATPDSEKAVPKK